MALDLAEVKIVYPGNKSFHLSDQVEFVPLMDIATRGFFLF